MRPIYSNSRDDKMLAALRIAAAIVPGAALVVDELIGLQLVVPASTSKADERAVMNAIFAAFA